MKTTKRDLIYIILILAAGVGGYYFSHPAKSPPASTALAAAPTDGSPAATPDEDKAQFPLSESQESRSEEQASKVPVTDANFEAALSELFGAKAFEALFNTESVAHKIVVTVESLLGPSQPKDSFLPLKSPDSDFVTSLQGDKTVIAAANYERYQAYVELLQGVNMARLVGIYRHFYPLFQNESKELGSKKYFNDRLISLIDNILKTPESSAPLEVKHSTPNGKYSFVDEKLENATPAQKILLRMGPDNSKLVKTKLREIRHLLTQP
jgi:hypothetical protein